MILFDMISYDMISYDMISYHIIRYDKKSQNMIKTKMIRIMLEKKDYDMKIRSFDTEFYCGSFYDMFVFCFIF